jgi:hypothetical protein
MIFDFITALMYSETGDSAEPSNRNNKTIYLMFTRRGYLR